MTSGPTPVAHPGARPRATAVVVAARGATAVALALLLACGGGGGDGDEAEDGDGRGDDAPATVEPITPEELPVDADGFYAPPDPLPAGRPGDLLRYQEVADPPDGVAWYRIMYLSETVQGDPTVVTGVVTVPDGEPPEGGWQLVAHAHGSTGLADACAPSVSLDDDRRYAPELLVFGTLAPERDYVVASTDYEGLGGPGRHPFLVGESEGRGVLDAARAARHLPGLDLAPTTAIAGYSQGGHAALWAHQIAADYAPDLDIVGTMAGAPATDMFTATGSPPPAGQEPFWAHVVAGYAAAYPDAEAALDAVLTPAGRAFVEEQLDTRCQDGLTVEPGERLLHADPLGVEPWASLLDGNVPGREAAPAPLLIVHGDQDRQVPVEASAALLERVCRAGQVAERRVVPGVDHVIAAVPAYEQGLEWFDALRSGTLPRSSCP
ncbi:MAG TPA: lipase family protein [Acidimicrobiales bacterium]